MRRNVLWPHEAVAFGTCVRRDMTLVGWKGVGLEPVAYAAPTLRGGIGPQGGRIGLAGKIFKNRKGGPLQ